MSNTCGELIQSNNEDRSSEPSTSQDVLTQQLQSQNCVEHGSNGTKTTEVACNNVTQKEIGMLEDRIQEIKIPSATVVNSKNETKSKTQTKILNENVNCVRAETRDEGSGAPATNKNTRKRERRKLHLQMPANAQNSSTHPAQAKAPHTAPPPVQNTANNLQNEPPPVQEFFAKFITPMYASTNSRYLENLIHHPQYQFENLQARNNGQVQHPSATVPSSPAMIPNRKHGGGNSNTGSFPNTPVMQSDPNSPRFVQNAMQHPLLSQSFPAMMYNGVNNPQYNWMANYWMPHLLSNTQYAANAQFAGNAQVAQNSQFASNAQKNEATPRRRRVKKNDALANYSFEPYISLQQVEEGLQNNTLIEGVVRINPKQFQHSYVSGSDRSEQDILIDGIKNRNRALEGDTVVVQMIECDSEDKTENKQKKGKVVYIKEKAHSRTCIGTLKLMPDKSRQKALFVPRDHRIPRLNVPFTSWPDNFYNQSERYENVLFLASIEEWNDTRFAQGKIVCHIGISGDMEAETRAILAQTDLDVTPYGPEYRHLYPRLDYIIPEEEIKIREDCRKMCIFSIDPFNCRDIDDAMSCRKLENGNYEVGVHISDVAHFLAENTELDEKVADKATTIYMVAKAYHMLPDELCMLCSLFPGVDKLAFSVFWEITEDAKILSHRFAKTVIHSCCQLAYEHAQAVLEDKKDAQDMFPELYNGFNYSDVYDSIKILGKLSAIRRKNRYDGGALRIDQPKLVMKIDPTNGLPESFKIHESQESHQLIEEFMLLANMTVADRIYEDHPKIAFLRCHPGPSLFMLKQLAAALKPMGIELEISSAGELYQSLKPHVDPNNSDRGKTMVLSMMCAKPMARAKYFCSGDMDDDDFHHYALNVPMYTHFTSPIRRYADIMVHRLLAASLNYRDVPKWKVDYVKMVAAQCNKQKFNAKKAGELSTELYILKYIEMNSPVITEAVVVEVKEKYIDVIIIAMGLNRRIFFNCDFPGEYKCIKNAAGYKMSKMEIKWTGTNNLPPVEQVIEVFSTLQVEMYRDEDMAKVDTSLVRPESA